MEPVPNALRLYDQNCHRLYLNQEERQRFLKVARKRPDAIKAFALTLLFCGCRIFEACALQPLSVQAESKTISLRCLKKHDAHVVREVPVPRELIQCLSVLTPHTNGYIWTDSGSPLRRITAYRWIKSIMAEAKISGAHACPKGLRHGYGVHATLCGVQIHMLQRWMGHASVSTTAIYATAIGLDERRIAERMW